MNRTMKDDTSLKEIYSKPLMCIENYNICIEIISYFVGICEARVYFCEAVKDIPAFCFSLYTSYISMSKPSDLFSAKV